MRSRLSYYSVLLLVGLAVTSGLILVMNPFNSPPASALATTQGAALAGGAIATNSTVSRTTSTSPGSGLGSILQPGGVLAGEHNHHDSDFSGEGAGVGNSTITTTTTTPVYSQHE
jgi:hypothetical protein